LAGATLNENSSGFTHDDFALHADIHQQMRNSEEMKRKFEGDSNDPEAKSLFDGEYLDFFKLTN